VKPHGLRRWLPGSPLGQEDTRPPPPIRGHLPPAAAGREREVVVRLRAPPCQLRPRFRLGAMQAGRVAAIVATCWPPCCRPGPASVFPVPSRRTLYLDLGIPPFPDATAVRSGFEVDVPAGVPDHHWPRFRVPSGVSSRRSRSNDVAASGVFWVRALGTWPAIVRSDPVPPSPLRLFSIIRQLTATSQLSLGQEYPLVRAKNLNSFSVLWCWAYIYVPCPWLLLTPPNGLSTNDDHGLLKSPFVGLSP